jgi:hypothetical protein
MEMHFKNTQLPTSQMEVCHNDGKEVSETNVTQRPQTKQKADNLFKALAKQPTITL